MTALMEINRNIDEQGAKIDRIEGMLKQSDAKTENMVQHTQQLQHTLKQVKREVKHSRTEIQMLVSSTVPREGISRRTDFEFQRITNEEELKELERHLEDYDYRTKLVAWLQSNIN
ncbi:hypothetical protein ZHAS_00000009 [Anopheles sinensis]|uniref:Uncharacterized protein n=1 Tax=Anopheles sinensis TaxID=74873 RepID=A0A084V9T1_ANOSI|nr:hypothetical protein ZHAS_00000009 [Anopheles sinensis]